MHYYYNKYEDIIFDSLISWKNVQCGSEFQISSLCGLIISVNKNHTSINIYYSFYNK